MCEEVARGWMMDFCFRSVCSSYRESDRDIFNKHIRLYEAIVDEEANLQGDHQMKRTICCFLSRIMDGKNLEVHYDPDDKVSPLMSASKVWEFLKDAVANVKLYEKIATLLYIQCVAVCLEKGNPKLAEETLQWLEKETQLPEKLQRKVLTVVTKNDIYDKLFTSFSYSLLLDSINTFLEAFLGKYPSDFLLKSAAKVIEARQERAESEQDLPEPASPDQTADPPKTNKAKVKSQDLYLRPKKKLFSTKVLQPWKPDTVKKPLHVPQRKGLTVSRRSLNSSCQGKKQSTVKGKQRAKKMWTWEEDKNLMSGVTHFGEGKWAQILQKFDFEERTSVMLKDRWRTLKKQGKVA